ncbi:hypothetical protein BHM03_00020114 [Ensete ventricosum]|nr:hypothetical protein BHM03_00020114 [Ensete ventricosum]
MRSGSLVVVGSRWGYFGKSPAAESSVFIIVINDGFGSSGECLPSPVEWAPRHVLVGAHERHLNAGPVSFCLAWRPTTTGGSNVCVCFWGWGGVRLPQQKDGGV